MTRRIFAGLLLAITASAALADDVYDKDPAHQLPRPDTKPADMSKPVQVFILMGQSNMFGMGEIGPEMTKGTLLHLTKTGKRYPHLLDDAGQWTKRADVRFTQVMTGKGDKMNLVRNDWLTVPANKNGGGTIGPELQFGHIMGHTIDAPVLVLKACIGNRSLGWDLLPPGSERYTIDGKTYAGYKDTPDTWIEGQPKKTVNWYAGKQYDDDVAHAKAVLANLETYYPGATKFEVAGFVWWQGHKDTGNPAHASRYEQNLVNLIKSLRKSFDAPNAKFVLATGCGNPGREGGGLKVAEAQLAMNDTKKYPDFAGNVKAVDTRDFWRDATVSPKNQGYHYNRNAETYMETGNALGWAMADLLKARSQ